MLLMVMPIVVLLAAQLVALRFMLLAVPRVLLLEIYCRLTWLAVLVVLAVALLLLQLLWLLRSMSPSSQHALN